jgi:hypothetical protein
MKGATREQWQLLCEQAAVEQDPEKMLILISEINRLLSEKEERLQNLRLRRDSHTGFPTSLKERQADSPLSTTSGLGGG